jgi:hypothetical protein
VAPVVGRSRPKRERRPCGEAAESCTGSLEVAGSTLARVECLTLASSALSAMSEHMELVVRVPWPCVTRRRGCVVQASKSSSNEPMTDGSASGVVGADSFRKSTFAHCFLPRQTPTTRPRNGDFASKIRWSALGKIFSPGCDGRHIRAAMPAVYHYSSNPREIAMTIH